MERPTGYATIGMLFAVAKKMALRYGVTNIQDIQLDSQNNGIKFILTNGDSITVPFDASEMPFIPGSSGLTANNVQDAIYELNENKQDIINELNKLSADLVDDTNSVNKFVTSEEKSQITTNKNDIINLQEQINVIESGMTPDVIIVGTPTITNNHISDFSSTNYLQFPTVFDVTGKTFIFRAGILTGNDIITQQNILDSNYNIALAINNGHFMIALSSNGTSWDIANSLSGTYNVEPNTVYYLQLSFDGNQYVLGVSTNKTDYIDDIIVISNLSLNNSSVYIGGYNNPWLGTINLEDWEASVNGLLVWRGIDDVGLTAKANIDLNNLSTVGQAKVLPSHTAIDMGKVPTINNQNDVVWDYPADEFITFTKTNSSGALTVTSDDWVKAMNNDKAILRVTDGTDYYVLYKVKYDAATVYFEGDGKVAQFIKDGVNYSGTFGNASGGNAVTLGIETQTFDDNKTLKLNNNRKLQVENSTDTYNHVTLSPAMSSGTYQYDGAYIECQSNAGNSIHYGSAGIAKYGLNNRYYRFSDKNGTIALLPDIFPNFSDSTSYNVGDLVYYASTIYGVGKLYKCTTAHTGAWSAADFTEVTVADILGEKADKNGVITLDNTTQTFDSTKTLQVQAAGIKIENKSNSYDYIQLRTSNPGVRVGNGINNYAEYRWNTIVININGNTVLMDLPTQTGKLALIQDIFPAFSTSSTYAVGDLVTYIGAFYRCTTAVTTAGSWTGLTNWTQTTLEAEIKAKANISDIPTAMTNAQIDTIMDAILV